MRNRINDMLNTLVESGDWQHRDFMGFDPFHLRDVRNVRKQEVGDIDSVIRRYNLTGQQLPPVKKVEAGYCPELVHLIWVGPADITKKVYKSFTLESVINSWQKHCKEKQIILWTNQLEFFKNKIDRANLIKFCRSKKIALIDADNLVDNMMSSDLIRVYCHEILSPNYGGASDVLRLSLLQLFGGIYADIDIEIIAPIKSIFLKHGIALNCLGGDLKSDVASADEINAASIMNNFFLALPGCAHLQRIINQLIESYSKPISSDREFGVKIENFLKNSKNHNMCTLDFDGHSFRTGATIYLTGPGLFNRVFGANRKEIIQNYDADMVYSVELGRPIKSAVHINHSANTWVPYSDKDNVPEQLQSHEQAFTLQRTLTYLLFNLQLEPRILFQNAYRALFYEHEYAYVIYKLLFTYYASMHSKIEFLGWVFYHSLGRNITYKNPYQLYKTGEYDKRLSGAPHAQYLISQPPNLLQLIVDGHQAEIEELIQQNPWVVDFEYTAFDAMGTKITTTPLIYAISGWGFRISHLIRTALDNKMPRGN